MTERYWTSEDVLRARRVLDARKLPVQHEEVACTRLPGGTCHGVAVVREEGWPLCRTCARRYLKTHREYNDAINHAVRIVVDVERGPHLVVSQ